MLSPYFLDNNFADKMMSILVSS